MKKIIALLTIAGMMSLGISNIMFAQDTEPDTTAETTAISEPAVETVEMVTESQPETFHEALKDQFIQGGPEFMGIVLLTLIFGLAISIERIIYLTLSTTNTKKLLTSIEVALKDEGIEKAKDICRDTRGPVASIFYQGLLRYDSGIDEVEKSIVSYGSVITGRLESGVSWISLFIALAPMLGFMGTVIGMIQAFDDIAAAGDISPQIVATGIKVALLTTVFGLIVAIILQIFYNYIVSKIDNLVNDMEDSSISFIDIVSKHNKK
ncbi:MAG: MotA/TolQ/ExbB proton channel family protein [Bacteroidales bacterium]|jgi:biopolymer transport protein ExbB|nr:MotA/TolQ/ExbB proton channel family protein [Bacteroidales bacterium]